MEREGDIFDVILDEEKPKGRIPFEVDATGLARALATRPDLAIATPIDLHNCWTCAYARDKAKLCVAPPGPNLDNERGKWVNQTHALTDPQCPPHARDCPSWAPRDPSGDKT